MHVCFNNHWKSLPTGKLFLVAPPVRARAVFGRYVMKCYQQQAVVIFDATFPGEKKKKGLRLRDGPRNASKPQRNTVPTNPTWSHFYQGTAFVFVFVSTSLASA